MNWQGEYSDVFRVPADVQVPAGYKFVDSKHPLPTTLYAREMTLARGRILYEVWDKWTATVLGCLVPSIIYSEAIANRDGPSLESWSTLRLHERNARHHAHRLILDEFPRISPTAAKIVAEKMISERRTVTKRNIEQNVVNHVRHCWTSYEFRLEQGESKKADVLEAVKERQREVLRSWLGEFEEGAQVAGLWKRHHLLDEEKKVEKGEEAKLFYQPTSLSWYAGRETAANLITGQHARL